MSLGRLQNEGDLERFLTGFLLRPEVRAGLRTGVAVWHNGVGAPTADIGDDGDYYLDTATKTAYVKQSGAWV